MNWTVDISQNCTNVKLWNECVIGYEFRKWCGVLITCVKAYRILRVFAVSPGKDKRKKNNGREIPKSSGRISERGPETKNPLNNIPGKWCQTEWSG